MPQLHSQLRILRKKSCITLDDVAYFLGTPDNSNMGRYEKGARPPTIEFLILYHLLLDVPIENFFPDHKRVLVKALREKIPDLIKSLEAKEQTYKSKRRMESLRVALTRLTNTHI